MFLTLKDLRRDKITVILKTYYIYLNYQSKKIKKKNNTNIMIKYIIIINLKIFFLNFQK